MLTAALTLAQVDLGQPALIMGIIAVLAGILILVVPRVLNYVVAAYLIIVGVLQIVAAL